jgi:proliferating cell nuclear antigen
MVALVNLKLNKSLFKVYEVEEGEITLNMERLYSILSRIESGDKVQMEVQDNRFILNMSNGSKRRFSIPLLKAEQENLPSLDDLEKKFEVVCDLKSDVLARFIGDASIVGDTVMFKVENSNVLLEIKGDNSEASLLIEKGSESLISINEGKAKSTFSVDYLSKIIKAAKLSDITTLKLGFDFPIKLEFKVPDKMELNFVLAPRIEEA